MTQPQGFQVSVPSLHNKQPVVVGGVLYFADSLVAVWIEERLGGSIPLVPLVALGVVAEGIPDGPVADLADIRLRGGTYFFNHHNGPDFFDVSAGVACDDIAASHPDVLARVLDYAFGSQPGQLDCPRISIEVHSTNERAIRAAEKIGFEIEGIKRGGGAKDGRSHDLVILGMLRHQCPFWPPRKPAEIPATVAA